MGLRIVSQIIFGLFLLVEGQAMLDGQCLERWLTKNAAYSETLMKGRGSVFGTPGALMRRY
jgi:hypothetical protein